MSTNNSIKADAIVIVNGNAYGIVQYVTTDGFYGVKLLNETRVDEWHPSQVHLAELGT